MKDTPFDKWLSEIESYSTRSMRLFDDLNQDEELYNTVKKWLYAAYEVGQSAPATIDKLRDEWDE